MLHPNQRRTGLGRSAVLSLLSLLVTAVSSQTYESCMAGEISDLDFNGGSKYSCASVGLKKIPYSLLPVAENTTWVNLANNNIETIPVYLFGRSPYGRRTMLVGLELQYNKIKHIQNGLFDRLTNLQYLNLDDNPLFAISSEFFMNIYNMTKLVGANLILPTSPTASILCTSEPFNSRLWVTCETCSGDLHFIRDTNDVDCCVPTFQENFCFTSNPTSVPTSTPTISPTKFPSRTPTVSPTLSPTQTPSPFPTWSLPTHSPTTTPTHMPTTSPTSQPTMSTPTAMPTSAFPTAAPTTTPPTLTPTTSLPTKPGATFAPTHTPSMSPTSNTPTMAPTMTTYPTALPTNMPSTSTPSTSPSAFPTTLPTMMPTRKTMYPLSVAAKLGLPCLMRQMLTINRTTIAFAAALVDAAREGHTPVVAILLDEARENNILDTLLEGGINAVTPLIAASSTGALDIVFMLVDAGASAFNALVNNVSPLFVASQHGHVSVVKYLLAQHGVAVTIERASSGNTPLRIAAKNGHALVVDELMKHGASTLRALDLAMTHNQLEVVKLLFKQQRPGTSVLHTYLREIVVLGHTQMLLFLIDSVYPHATELLSLALGNDNRGCASLLLSIIDLVDKQKICSENTDPFYIDVLFGVVRNDLVEGVCTLDTLMVQRVSATEPNTMLCVAIINDHDRVASTIAKLSSQQSLIACDDGVVVTPPLVLAAQRGLAQTTTTLVNNLARHGSSCAESTEAVLASLVYGHNNLTNILVGDDVACLPSLISNPLLSAAASGNVHIVDMLLQRGDSMYVANVSDGATTPLVAAVAGGHVDVFTMMKVQATTSNDGWTPELRATLLLSACRTGQHEMVVTLLALWGATIPTASSTSASASVSAPTLSTNGIASTIIASTSTIATTTATVGGGGGGVGAQPFTYTTAHINNALLATATSGSVTVATLLMSSPFNADVNFNDGVTSTLFVATEMGFGELVKLLIENNASVTTANWRQSYQLTLVDTAITFKHLDIALDLLTAGATVDVNNADVIVFDVDQNCLSTPTTMNTTIAAETTVVTSTSTVDLNLDNGKDDLLGLGIGLQGTQLLIIVGVFMLAVIGCMIWRCFCHTTTVDKLEKSDLDDEDQAADYQDITHLTNLRFNSPLPNPVTNPTVSPPTIATTSLSHHQGVYTSVPTTTSSSTSPQPRLGDNRGTRVRSGYENLAVQHLTDPDAWVVDSANPAVLFNDLEKDRNKGPFHLRSAETGNISNWDATNSGDLGLPMRDTMA